MQGSGAAASATAGMATFTTIQLILIALVALLIVFAMIWGVRAKRLRKAQVAQIETVEAGSAPVTDEQVETPPPVAAAPAEAAPDDLTRLKGLGPKVAARLGELGVTRFADLAALDAARAATIDGQLGTFAGRMARDRWIEQARYLAAGDQPGFEAEFGKLG